MIDLLRELLAPIKAPLTASSEAPGDPGSYRVVFDEAVRAIEGQRSSVDEVRSRSGVLLSAAALVAGFLGPSALAGNAPTWILAVATGLLLISAALSVAVLLPSDTWRFTVGTRDLLGTYVEGEKPATLPELHRSLAWYLDEAWATNQTNLIRLYRFFSAAAILVVVDTVFWLVAIALRGP